MAEPSFLGVFQDFLVGVGGFGVGGYAVWRKLRRDQKEDGLDERFTKQIDALQTQLQAERTENAKLGEVIDMISSERNEAVKQVGQLEGQVLSLEKEVHRLRDDVSHLQTENQHLRDEVHSLSSKVTELTTQILRLIETCSGVGGSNGS